MGLLRWLGVVIKTPAVYVIAPVAYALGIATMLPLGYDLLPNAATAIAAGVTSIVTVGGAVLLWQFQQHKESTAVAHFVASLFDAAVHGLKEISSHFDDLDTMEGWLRLEETLLRQNGTLGSMSVVLHGPETIMKLPSEAVSQLTLLYPNILKELNKRLHNLRHQFVSINQTKLPRPIEEMTELVNAIAIYKKFSEALKDAMGVHVGGSLGKQKYE